ncbi:MAG: hypothetical protein V1824_04520 [archaeon]
MAKGFNRLIEIEKEMKSNRLKIEEEVKISHKQNLIKAIENFEKLSIVKKTIIVKALERLIKKKIKGYNVLLPKNLELEIVVDQIKFILEEKKYDHIKFNEDELINLLTNDEIKQLNIG